MIKELKDGFLHYFGQRPRTRQPAAITIDDGMREYLTGEVASTTSTRTPLDEKLSAVKDEYGRVIKEREYSINEDCRTVFELAKKHGIVTGEYDPFKNREQEKISEQIWMKLHQRFDVKSTRGLESLYYSIDGIRFSVDGAQDAANYEQVKRDALSFFKAKYGNEAIYQDSLEAEIEKFTEAHNLAQGKKFYGLSPGFHIYLEIMNEFHVVKKPAKKYTGAVPGLEDALKKL